MTTPKKIIIQDLELADKEIARLKKENKEFMINGILTQKERDKNGMDLIAIQIENKRLRKENKKLKEYKENLIRTDKKKTEHIEELEEENKELKNKLDKLRTDNIYEEGLYE